MIIFLPKKAKPSVVQFLSDQDAWAASQNLTKKNSDLLVGIIRSEYLYWFFSVLS